MPTDNAPSNGADVYTTAWIQSQTDAKLQGLIAAKAGKPGDRKRMKAELTRRNLAAKAAQRAASGEPAHADPVRKGKGSGRRGRRCRHGRRRRGNSGK